MGKTYTDFSQLSKGMFRKGDPVVEIKPIPKKSAEGEDALAYFGLTGTGNGNPVQEIHVAGLLILSVAVEAA